MQCDEQWALGQQDKHCAPTDPAAAAQRGIPGITRGAGSQHRLVGSGVAGQRTADRGEQGVQDFNRRTGGRLMTLIPRDEYWASAPAILTA